MHSFVELSQNDIDAVTAAVTARADEEDPEGAWAAAEPLWQRSAHQRQAAVALLRLVDRQAFTKTRSLEILRRAFDTHAADPALLAAIGEALEAAHDVRFLNAAPPSDPLFERVATRLDEQCFATRAVETEVKLLGGLATASRLLGRSWDAVAERAHRRLVLLRPDRWQDHYNLGLFFKTRGRFPEAVVANRRAAELGGDDEGVQWNLGICATGARDGTTALAVWRALGQHVELGRFGLPEGSYAHVKVRLAERPVATRLVDENEPGLEETVWVERLSPCHGIVRSALFQELGVDYGDVVLFDGAPIMHQTYGETQVPVFPHLATLARPGYRIFPFVGTQPAPGLVDRLSESLPEDALVYSHTENTVVLCAHCWQDDSRDHGAHRPAEHCVVRGKLCVPPTVAPTDIRRALDDALSVSGVRLFVPLLSELLGDHARADVERRRMAMIGPPPHGG